jgi:hypothetical protein
MGVSRCLRCKSSTQAWGEHPILRTFASPALDIVAHSCHHLHHCLPVLPRGRRYEATDEGYLDGVMRSFGGFDADGDGTIEFDEFKQLYSHLGACILASRQKTVSPSGASIS